MADAGPLIALAKLDHLNLLGSLFSRVIVPQIVLTEATRNRDRPDAALIEDYAGTGMRIESSISNSLTNKLSGILDTGEVQALALAKQLGCGVLMDEKRGRQVARQLNIPVVGIPGLLLQAKQQGKVSEMRPLLYKLQETDYQISTELLESAFRMAGE